MAAAVHGMAMQNMMLAAKAMGKKTKEIWPKPGQLPLSELVVENSF